MPIVLPLATLVAAAVLSVWAGASDLVRYRIPNLASLGLAAAFALFALSAPVGAVEGLSHLIVGAAALALGLFAFARGLAGGGDGKLFAAVALWAGPERILPTLLLMALIGGVLALAQVLTVQQMRAREAGTGLIAAGLPRRADLQRAQVPYGVAIAGAGLYVLWGLAAPLI